MGRAINRFVDLLARQSRGGIVVVFALTWGTAYMATNHYPLREPSLLPFFPFETAIPFLGWTVLVYLSAFPQAVGAAWLLDRETLARGAAAAYGLVVLHVLVFAIFPTTYPRPVDPAIDSPLLAGFYRTFCLADSPRNCFPSLHVSMATLLSMALRRCRPWLGVVYLCWTFLIVLSTLTTKQHYALDVFGGAAIAIVAYHLVFSRTK